MDGAKVVFCYHECMSKIELLRQKVAELYNNPGPDSADYVGWIYPNHVLIVAKHARELALKYAFDADLCEAAGLLHDIADVTMPRGPRHAEESARIARDVLREVGYGDDVVTLLVDDALRFHSCHGDERPASDEGKVLASADSIAHLTTDFYVMAAHGFFKDESLERLKSWALEKFDRDLDVKIFFDEEREQVRPDYEALKRIFSR